LEFEQQFHFFSGNSEFSRNLAGLLALLGQPENLGATL
jgi:hypothetical protein